MDKENVNFEWATQRQRREAYLREKSGWNAQRRAHSQDDESEFPAFDETDGEGSDEADEGLDKLPRLVANTLLDLIDITANANINMSTNDLQSTATFMFYEWKENHFAVVMWKLWNFINPDCFNFRLNVLFYDNERNPESKDVFFYVRNGSHFTEEIK